MSKTLPSFYLGLQEKKLMDNFITSTAPKTISILGCGWYGFELAKKLVQQHYIVKGSSTTPEKLDLLATHRIRPFLINFQKDKESYDPAFFQTDVLFICIPPNRRAGQQSDFSAKIAHIANAAKLNKVNQVVFISSTAVYGDINEEITELTVARPETESGRAILEAEKLLSSQQAFTSTIIRFGGLIGPEREPGRFFAGKTDVPNGRAPINLIHLDDCIGLSLSLLKNGTFGHIYNACSPDHPSKQQFYTTAALRTQLPAPVFKDELLNWKIISTIQSPLVNYKYLVSNWIEWLHKDS